MNYTPFTIIHMHCRSYFWSCKLKGFWDYGLVFWKSFGSAHSCSRSEQGRRAPPSRTKGAVRCWAVLKLHPYSFRLCILLRILSEGYSRKTWFQQAITPRDWIDGYFSSIGQTRAYWKVCLQEFRTWRICFQTKKLSLLFSTGLLHSYLFLSPSLTCIYVFPPVFALWQDKVFACFSSNEPYLQFLDSLISGIFLYRNSWGWLFRNSAIFTLFSH